MKLGELPTVTVHQRDAVHVAIANVCCKSHLWLSPGWHVGVNPDDYDDVGPCYFPHIGIVDPFLKQRVTQGQRFLICLYPETTTSLKHVWTHPSFRSTP